MAKAYPVDFKGTAFGDPAAVGHPTGNEKVNTQDARALGLTADGVTQLKTSARTDVLAAFQVAKPVNDAAHANQTGSQTTAQGQAPAQAQAQANAPAAAVNAATEMKCVVYYNET